MPTLEMTLMINKLEKLIKNSQITPSKQKLASYLADLIQILAFIHTHEDEKYPLEVSLGVFLNHKPNLLLNAIEQHAGYTDELDAALLPYRSQTLTLAYDATTFKASHSEENLPELTIERDKHGKIISYSDPDDKLAHQHGAEARRIGFSTLWENIKALLNRFFALFHIYVFESARYQEHDYHEATLYTNDEAIGASDQPSSYWIGHASNFMVIPTTKKPIHVLTDPVEGGLAPVLYSRRTHEGKTIDGIGEDKLPKVDVVIISHNHRDHVKPATLVKLLKQQPLMVIPEGDLALFKNLGFKHIQTLKWWEQAKIKDASGETLLTITSTPAKHWSGRGLHDAHHSAFMGFMVESNAMSGAIYFAGDTALMSEAVTNPLFKLFNVTTSIQPGGPDERREDMESTHQSSADGIILHFRNLLIAHQNSKDQTIEHFNHLMSTFKTIYDHTATFKLGNLRQRDTFYSYQRMVAMFEENRDEAWVKSHLAPHEYHAYCAIHAVVNQMTFSNAGPLDNQAIAKMIQNHIIVPRIGQRFDVGSQPDSPAFSHRDLIINRRVLIEADHFTETYLKKCENVDFEALSKTLLSTYLDGFNRTHRQLFDDTLKKGQDTAGILKELEDKLGYKHRHGHLQNLVHYVKWVNQFKDNPEGLKAFLTCQRVKGVVNQAIKKNSSFFGGEGQRLKRQMLMQWANELEKNPAEVGALEKKVEAVAGNPGFFTPKEKMQFIAAIQAVQTI